MSFTEGLTVTLGTVSEIPALRRGLLAASAPPLRSRSLKSERLRNVERTTACDTKRYAVSVAHAVSVNSDDRER